jgi:thiol-disulfide isomerase/thioredoxin
MKVKSVLIVLFLLYSAGIALADDTLTVKGIQFRHLTLEEAVAAAKKENKFVYLHGFADWCTHCKAMAENIYTDDEVAKLYNANYVCIKMDMEKEGKAFAQKFKVTSYPALFYFDSNGDVVHRAKGERNKAEFMELGRDATDPKKNLKYYENTFNSGQATRDEAYRYLLLVGKAGLDNQFKLNNYLMKLTDEQLLTPEYWKFIFDFLTDHTLAITQRFIDNKKAFEAKFTSDSVNTKITGIYISEMMRRVQRLDTTGYMNIKLSLLNSKLDIAEKICAYADLTTYRIKADWPNYIANAPAFIEKYCHDDAKKLNETAQQFAERATDNNDVLKAEQWAKRSIELNDTYKYNMTLTSVQIKLGKKEDALKTAKHALELGQKANMDTKQVMLLVDRIEGMQ